MSSKWSIPALMGARWEADALVAAYISAAGITDRGIINATYTMVSRLRSTGLLSLFDVVLPFAGGTSISCSINLMSPGTYDMSFINSPTFSSDGVDFNGSSQYGDSNYNVGLLTTYDRHFSLYWREASNPTGWNGAYDVTVDRAFGMSQNATPTFGFALGLNNDVGYGVSDLGAGYYLGTIRASNDGEFYQNGVSLQTVPAPGASPNSRNFFLGALNADGSPILYNSAQCAFLTLGRSVTSAQAFLLNSIVEQFQDSLNRGVQ